MTQEESKASKSRIVEIMKELNDLTDGLDVSKSILFEHWLNNLTENNIKNNKN